MLRDNSELFPFSVRYFRYNVTGGKGYAGNKTFI